MERTPREIAERRIELSAEYGQKSDRLKEILEIKATQWLTIRERSKSDKSADMEWQSTDFGIEEMKLKMDLKTLEKKMSAARTYLEVMDGEAKNQW